MTGLQITGWEIQLGYKVPTVVAIMDLLNVNEKTCINCLVIPSNLED